MQTKQTCAAALKWMSTPYGPPRQIHTLLHTLQSCSSKWIIHICSTVEWKKKGRESKEGKKGCRRMRQERRREAQRITSDTRRVRKDRQARMRRHQRRNFEKLISLFLRASKIVASERRRKTERSMEEEKTQNQIKALPIRFSPPPPSLLNLNSWLAD